jgi:hypothetical protein
LLQFCIVEIVVSGMRQIDLGVALRWWLWKGIEIDS